MIIRRALSGDAPAIARVHVNSWRTTYQGIIPDNYLNSLSYEQRTELWKRNIMEKDNFVIVAEDEEGQVVDFADAWKRETNIVEVAVDLTSIYLLEEYQGKGVGKKLLKILFEHLKQMGYKKVFVEVLEENKSRYFYEYYGAKVVKTIQIKIAGKTLNELILEWDNIDDVIGQLRDFKG